MSWNENENRFENNELKWIADFIVGNLCFVRKDLQIMDDEATAFIMEALWKTLDLLSDQKPSLQAAMSARVQIFQQGLMQIFQLGVVNKD